MAADARRGKVHDLADRLFQHGVLYLAGPVGVHIDRKRLGDADGIAQLDGAAFGQLGGNDVLGQIAGGIGGRTVDLGGVLTGKGSPAMRRGAAIGIDDNLAAGQAGIAVGTHR